MSTYQPVRRPGTVTAAAVLLYVMGGLGLLGGVLLLALSGEAGDKSGLVAFLSLLTIALAVAYLVLATKILGGSNGARITAIVFMGIGIVLELVDWSAGSIITIGLALLVIGLLAWAQDAKEYFEATKP